MKQKPERAELEWVEIPRGIRELLKAVTLTADVMFVNGIDHIVAQLTFEDNITYTLSHGEAAR